MVKKIVTGTGRFCQIIVAFFENMNFNYVQFSFTVSSQSSTTSSQSTTQGSNLTSLNPPAASPTTPQAIQVLR